MSTRKAAATAKPSDEVVVFLATLKHPLKSDIEKARRIMLGAAPEIGEGIKWNAPSFRTTEYFATTNLRSLDRVQFVFHVGAKKRADLPTMKLADPAGLVKWLAKDRCLVTIGAGKELAANRTEFEAVIRTWIKYV